MISGKIHVKKCLLNLKMMLEGGQCFRWKEVSRNEWVGVVLNVVWTLKQFDQHLEYSAYTSLIKEYEITDSYDENLFERGINFKKENLEQFLLYYLRLEEPLEKYYEEWGNRDTKFNSVAEKCYGIRMLNQHPVENLFSFICSSNNNIIRISSMVEKLCTMYGNHIGSINGRDYYSFPEISKLSSSSINEALRKAGFGYRAKYIQQSAKHLNELGGLDWLLKLRQCSYTEAKAELIKLQGIGPKVADCICLMSLGHMGAVPVDTHVFQIACQNYMAHLKSVKSVTDKIYKEIGDFFRNLYGPLAGWAHTILFCGDLKTFKNSESPVKSQLKRKYTKKDSELELSSVSGMLKCSKKDLNLKLTFNSGQTYRFKELEPDLWRGVFAGKIWTFKQCDDSIQYTCSYSHSASQNKTKINKIVKTLEETTQCEELLNNYFRIDFPLEKYYNRWSLLDEHFKSISKKFSGIRMIKQEIIENLFTFICSSNNTIARMSTMTEKMCSLYGNKIGTLNNVDYYDFPSLQKLAEKSVLDDLVKNNFGFRAKYVHNSAKYIIENGGYNWIKNLQSLPYDEAKIELMKLPGVAAKIADCICLTALHHLETIPVDTHVFQIAKRYYLPHLKNQKTVSAKAYEEIGECFRKTFVDYAGWAHTILFCSDLKQHNHLLNE